MISFVASRTSKDLPIVRRHHLVESPPLGFVVSGQYAYGCFIDIYVHINAFINSCFKELYKICFSKIRVNCLVYICH